MAKKELTIGDVSRRTGLAVSAIHFYEIRGLVHPARTRAGHRRFRPSDIRRISFIKIAQELGFPLSEISAQLARLPDNRTPNKADWSKISKAFRGDINLRIERLTRLRDKLDGCIGCGCLSLKSCALYNPDDAAWSDGSGARFLLDNQTPQS